MTLLEIAEQYPLRFINAVSMSMGETEPMFLDYKILGYALQEYKDAPFGLMQIANDKLALGL